MSAHTPEPWTIVEVPSSRWKSRNTGEEYRGYRVVAGERLVAVVPDGFFHGDATREQAPHNARLIATAPDLLAALRDCATALDEAMGRALHEPADYASADRFAKGAADYRRHCEALVAARAALRKAEGQA